MNSKVLALIFVVLVLVAGGVFLFRGGAIWEVRPDENSVSSGSLKLTDLPSKEASKPDWVQEEIQPKGGVGDIAIQSSLQNPPATVKAIYATGWSAGSSLKLESLIKLIDETELNALVVDVKDYSGFISYRFDYPLARESGAFGELRILKPNTLIKKLHDKGIYVIGRISVFQDPILALAHPEWAIKSSSTGAIWKDRKGLSWMDPSSREVWAYDLAIAKDALSRGFDEINFDYIRFPSDGNLNDMRYPFWNEKTAMRDVIGTFFRYLRNNLKGVKISADLFGLVTVDETDLGIGQSLETAFPYFDYIAPMVYPSHYAAGSFGYKNPAAYPYEIVKYSLEKAQGRLLNYGNPVQLNSSTTTSTVKIKMPEWPKFRPWLQDFDLGADYTAPMVRAQIRAVEELSEGGWMLWDPKNNYTREALN